MNNKHLAKALFAFTTLFAVNLLVSCGSNNDQSHNETVTEANQAYVKSLSKFPPLANAHLHLSNEDQKRSLYCQHRVIYLPQADDASEVTIAQFITDHSDVAVFWDQTKTDLTLDKLSPNEVANAGPIDMLLVSKVIPTIHTAAPNVKKMGLMTADQAARLPETTALQAVHHFWDVHPEQRDVILIFESGHKFVGTMAKCLVIPLEFSN